MVNVKTRRLPSHNEISFLVTMDKSDFDLILSSRYAVLKNARAACNADVDRIYNNAVLPVTLMKLALAKMQPNLAGEACGEIDMEPEE